MLVKYDITKAENEVRGWKTVAGGIGAILTSLGGIAIAVSQPDVDPTVVLGNLQMFFIGLVGVGLGHKFVKMLSVLLDAITNKPKEE